MVYSAICLQRPSLDHSAGLNGEKASAQAGISGNKSFMRFVFAQRIRIETLRPVMFCWCLIFRSLVSSTSHRPSASVRSSPFFLDPKSCLPHRLGLVAEQDWHWRQLLIQCAYWAVDHPLLLQFSLTFLIPMVH